MEKNIFENFRPSSSKRQLNCTKSLLFKQVVSESNQMAFRGSCLHTFAERLYLNPNLASFNCVDYDNDIEYTLTDSDIELIKSYVEYLKLKTLDTSVVGIESDVMLHHIDDRLKDKKGTIDFYILNDAHLEIIDLKTGVIDVEQKDNYQLYIYAYCKAMDLMIYDGNIIDKVSITIYQNFQPNTITLNFYEIEDFIIKNVKNVLKNLTKDNLVYKPDSYCNYCPNAKGCKALYDYSISINDNAVSTNEKIEALKKFKLLSTIVDAYKKDIIRDVSENPNNFTNVKLAKNNRYIIDTNKFESFLDLSDLDKDLFYENKLLSQTKIKKVIKDNSIDLDLKEFTTLKEYDPKIILK